MYQVRYRGNVPAGTGSGFWLKFRSTNPPLIEERHRDIYFCPVKGEYPDEPGTSDYRGPAVPFDRLSSTDPLGADKEGNHGGDDINVLLKDGSVREASRGEPLWSFCRTFLSP